MDGLKTLDVKGISHDKRQALIFPGVEALKTGETLRIIVEFNPIPLVFMLKAKNEFEISNEKEGPDEWILQVKRIAGGDSSKKEQFKKLLKEMKSGSVSEKTKAETKELLKSVDAKTLALMEQELINEVVTHEEIRGSLCDIHLDLLGDALVAQHRAPNRP